MGMCISGGIFQAKVDNILSGIKGFKTYTKYILALIKETFTKHITHLRVVYYKLRNSGLKINASNEALGQGRYSA